MVGFAWNVGHGLTYKVLTDDTQKSICCSRLRLASDAENKLEEARRMQPSKDCFFFDSKHDFDDPTTTLPTLEAFDCPFVDDDDDKSRSGTTPATNSPSDRGASDEEDRGENILSDKGNHPVVETPDDYDGRDRSLRPDFGPEETSSRCLIEDYRIAKIYPINTKLEKRFFNGKWYPGTVISGPYQFDDEMPVAARWEIVFDDGDREFLSVD